MKRDECMKELAKEKFMKLLNEQLDRVERLKREKDFLNYQALPQIVVGIVGGDGIGPAITAQAAFILEVLLKDEIAKGKVALRNIEGLTIERRAAVGKAIPDDVLEELKACHVILKGPTTTPQAGSPWPNIESAKVAMRKELDLFANVRPIRVPEKGIDWTFYRENTEGAYAVGSKGFDVNEDLALDFTVTTTQGTRRIVEAAFEYAKANGKTRVTAVTKANVIKATDGKFLRIAREIARNYPGIELDEWYIDIMTAKLIDEKRRTQFQVLVLPNLYGDILTDEAAEFQGGVGTAGSANIGKRCAMFEAIHGSAPRMVEEGRAQYADPASIIRAAAMLLGHIGYPSLSEKLTKALDKCAAEKKVLITGRSDGATSEEFAKYVIESINFFAHSIPSSNAKIEG
jgi:isocitrate dehydrogenase (NAD+)